MASEKSVAKHSCYVKNQGSPSSKKQQFPFKISFRLIGVSRDFFKNVFVDFW